MHSKVIQLYIYAYIWRWKWQPTLEFLPGKSHGQRSLAGYTVHGVARIGHYLATKPEYAYIIFHIIFHYKLLQDIDYSSLCCINLCCLLYIYADVLSTVGFFFFGRNEQLIGSQFLDQGIPQTEILKITVNRVRYCCVCQSLSHV